MLNALADDVEWSVPGPREAPDAGARKGPGEVARFFAQVAETVEFIVSEPRAYVAAADRVVAPGHTRAPRAAAVSSPARGLPPCSSRPRQVFC